MKIGACVIVVSAFALASCWLSDKPLIPSAEMDWPQLERTYLSETFPDEDVITITRKEGHFDVEETALFDRTLTSTYRLNFDELKPGWYLIQIQPGRSDRPNSPDYSSHTYYELARVDGPVWQEFSFWPACPNVAEEFRSNLEELKEGCSFKEYSLLRKQALLSTDRLFYNSAYYDAVKNRGLSSAHYKRSFRVHHGEIPWSKPAEPEPWLTWRDFLSLPMLIVALTSIVLLPIIMWLITKSIRHPRV